MSIKYLNKAWETSTKTSTQKLVLMSLADQANEAGVCWPSIASTARRTGVSGRQVIRVIADLKTAGLVSVRRRLGGPEGGRETNIYTLHLFEGDNSSLSLFSEGDTSAGESDTHVTPTTINHHNTPLARDREVGDLETWCPSQWAVDRARTVHPTMTDAFIDAELISFRTYAETRHDWRDEQLDAKFQNQLTREYVKNEQTQTDQKRYRPGGRRTAETAVERQHRLAGDLEA